MNPDQIRAAVASALAEVRSDAEVSTLHVAAALFMDPKVYARLERGERAEWWRLTFGDKQVRLVDLPASLLDDVAQASGVSWNELLWSPLEIRTLKPALLLVARAAEYLGAPMPPGDVSLAALDDYFDTVPSDLPPDVDAPDDDAESRVDPTGSANSTPT